MCSALPKTLPWSWSRGLPFTLCVPLPLSLLMVPLKITQAREPIQYRDRKTEARAGQELARDTEFSTGLGSAQAVSAPSLIITLCWFYQFVPAEKDKTIFPEP